MQDMRNIRISWQAGVVICAMMILPAAGAGLLATLREPERRSTGTVQVVSGVVIAISLLVAWAAVRSRVGKMSKEKAGVVVGQVFRGIFAMAAAMGLSAATYFMATALKRGFISYQWGCMGQDW